MRVENSIKNVFFNITYNILFIVLGFLTRKIFIQSLGDTYLGLLGILNNIFAMLSLVEGGVGVSIVYHLYKPIAEDKKDEIIALVQLYRKTYYYLSFTVMLICAFLYPFVVKWFNGNEISLYQSFTCYMLLKLL